MMPREPIPTVVRKLAKELAEPTPMRRGSVSERFMKCGQKECRCQHDPQARHGPYFTLTRSEEGKTRSRYLSAEQAALARQHVEAGHEIRRRRKRRIRLAHKPCPRPRTTSRYPSFATFTGNPLSPTRPPQ